MAGRRQCEGLGYNRNPANMLVMKAGPSNRPAPFGVDSSPQELRIFDLFRKEIVFHITGALDRSFWAVHVLQASHVYPHVWHSCLALAAIHKRGQISDQEGPQRDNRKGLYIFAIQQYNFAVRLISDRLQADAPSTSYAQRQSLLFSCILFFGVSSLLGDFKQAISHMHGALQLYCNWEMYDNDTEHKAVYGCIFPAQMLDTLINRVRKQLWTFSGEHAAFWTKSQFRQGRQEPFQNSRDAYVQLELICSHMLKQIHCQQQQLQQLGLQKLQKQRQKLVVFVSALATWKENLDRLKLRQLQTGIQDPGMDMVETSWLATDLLLRQGKNGKEASRAEYARIVEKYEQIATQSADAGAGAGAEQCPKQQYGLVFSFTSSMCEQLGFVAFACRDGQLRRRAVSLLKSIPIREGLCDAGLLAAMSEIRIEAEESGAAEDKDGDTVSCQCVPGGRICYDHQVAVSLVNFSRDGQLVLELSTFRDLRLGRPFRKVPLQWRG